MLLGRVHCEQKFTLVNAEARRAGTSDKGCPRGATIMQKSALRPSLMQDLKARLRGELICPTDQGYDAARKVWGDVL